MSVSDLMPEHPQGSIHTGSVAEDLARGQVDLKVTVVSPSRELYSDEAHWVTLPGIDGQFGVWPRHVTMVAALGSGLLRIGLRGNGRVEFAVRGSFLSVADDVVTILVDRAVTKDEIDVEAVRAELAETNAAFTQSVDDAEFLRLLEHRDWCQARIKLATS